MLKYISCKNWKKLLWEVRTCWEKFLIYIKKSLQKIVIIIRTKYKLANELYKTILQNHFLEYLKGAFRGASREFGPSLLSLSYHIRMCLKKLMKIVYNLF